VVEDAFDEARFIHQGFHRLRPLIEHCFAGIKRRPGELPGAFIC
jgi:hypothetical protein